ncbi:LCP family glycopolymer transferase [Lapidilactobacillus bayanensis]|uniref:LCP family glycopolymer transferase n=1 Tax=Lapidilactobacillus bayanensis TaxID=2485998 RepID=UPI000F794919|nr:LCP family protein [Lapidilactobacillus bayanensis]
MNDNEQLHRTGQQHHHHRGHAVRKVIIGIIIALIVAVLGYAAYFYFSAKNALDSSYKSAGETQSAKTVVDAKKPLSILLLGADTGAFGRNYQGRTDTMIVATINPSTKQTTLTSIPRDTMAQLVGAEKFDYERINAAYEVGGSKVALKSVSALLNIPLQYYVTINMGGMEKIVSAVGGVDITPTLTFTYEGNTFTKGEKMHLDGKQALAYSRMRYDDPNGDYGRQTRQREVITSIIKAAVSTRTLTNFQDVLTQVSKNMTTNLAFADMVSIFSKYRGYAETIKSDHLQGVNAMWGKAMIQIPATTELQRVSDNLRTEMGLEKATLDNQATRQNKLNIANGFSFTSGSSTQQFTVYSPNSDTEQWTKSSN